MISSSLFEFRVDDSNYLSQSAKGLEIKSSNLDLSASNVQISSNEASVSIGTSREIILDGKDDVSVTVGNIDYYPENDNLVLKKENMLLFLMCYKDHCIIKKIASISGVLHGSL